MKFLKMQCIVFAAAAVLGLAAPLAPIRVQAAEAAAVKTSKQYQETMISLPKEQFAGHESLYICAFGSAAFEKVLDGASCSLRQKNLLVSFTEQAPAADGCLYGIVRNQSDIEAGKSGFRLVRYSPV